MKNNYKAKWEALKSEKDTGAQKCVDLKPVLKNAQVTGTNAIIEFNTAHKAMMEMAAAARQLVQLMDESSEVGTIEFGVCGGLIDEKLSQLDMQTMARRTRDILRVSAARIGILSAAYEELEEKVGELTSEITSLSSQTRNLQSTLVSSVYIGNRPTSSEVEDFVDNGQKTKYRRFGVEYDDLEDDWEETALFATSVLREKKSESDNSGDEDEEDESPSYVTSVVTTRTNRSAQVVPRSRVADIAL